MPDPKRRTERWISTSYPESQWNSSDCKFCGPEYFTNNLVSCVRFNDALKKIPSNAIIIEIAPHTLLQSILRRVVGPKASYHGLMKKNQDNSMLFFMESLGSLYQVGLNPKIELLFPAVKFPVPRGTPMISDLIKWNHSQSFKVPKFSPGISEFSRKFTFERDNAYLLDYKVDGKALFPAAGFISLAWEALAKKHRKDFKEMPVVIENFEIHKTTIINDESFVKFSVGIQESSGRFEIMEGKSLVASGKIYETFKDIIFSDCTPVYTNNGTCVSGQDIYDELKCSGYEYGDAFRSIVECNVNGTLGLIQWQERWITFLENHFLLSALAVNKKGTMLPKAAEFVKIDPNVVRAYIQAENSTKIKQGIKTCNFPCSYNPETRVCSSIGVEIGHLKIEYTGLCGEDNNAILEEHMFIPYESSYELTESSNLLLSQYLFACKELAKNLVITVKNDAKESQFKMEMINDIHLEETESSENKLLLKMLESISNDSETFKDKKKEYLAAYSHMAGKDILNNLLVNEDSLRIMLEIIGENTYTKLNIVEVNHNFPVVSVHVKEIVRKYQICKFDRMIVFTTKSIVINQESLFNEQKIQQRSYDSLKDLEKERPQDLAIGSFTCGPLSNLKNLLCSLTSVIKPNGFVLLFFKEKINAAEKLLSFICGDQLLVQSVTELEKVLHNENLLILSKISDPFGGSLYLLRAPNIEKPQTFLQIKSENYDWVEKVKKELYGKNTGVLWLVAEDGPISGILGFVNCLKHEPGSERIRCVFISRKKEENHFPSFSKEHPFFQSLITKNMAINVWKKGTWGSYRYKLLKETKQPKLMEHSYVNCKVYGNLSSFEWVESSVKYVSRQNQKLVHIYYSAVNCKDVMLATGKISIGTTPDLPGRKSVLGLEFSGREEGTGKRICGLMPAGAMATSALVDPTYCLEIPQNWTMEEAATVPLAYVTCYYSLIVRAKLQPSESILIHSGSDGIGIAAITIAMSLNCDIFTTVDNDEKRAYLRRRFPHIKKENIGSSRDTSFETMVLSRTSGRGVDVILNSFVDERNQANFRCISSSGRIIEILEHDSALDNASYSKIMLKNVSFHAVFLDKILRIDPKSKGIVQETMGMVRDGIKVGVVQPLDRTVFDIHAIKDVFRYMEKGNHLGKVLLKIRDEEPQKCALPKPVLLPAKPETQFYYNRVYIIIGGLGGFGMELTKWAIDRGAKNIILTSRFEPKTPYNYFCLKKFRDEGINVEVSTLNATKRNEAQKLLEDAMSIGPLGGIFNSSTVFTKGLLETLTPDDFKVQCASKSEATKNLDELTRTLCPDMDYFVCFSSMAAGRGYASMTHYGYANSIMDRICEERRKDGLHGLSIQWGIIGDLGLARQRIDKSTLMTGVAAQSVKGCLQTLDIFCQQESPVVTSYVPKQQNENSDQRNEFRSILKILGIKETTEINMTRKLKEIGIDSLVGTEIREMIKNYSNVDITVQNMLEMNLHDIKAILEKTVSEASAS